MSYYELKKHQIEPVDLIQEALSNKSSRLVIGGTGTGKTVIAARAVALAQEKGYLPKHSSKVASVLYLGPNPIQTQRVFFREGVKNTAFLNYPALRSAMGEMLIQWESKLIRGDIDYIPVWYHDELPDLIFADECQKLKNPDSLQTKCVIAAINAGVPVIFMSATPYQKAAEAFTIFVGLRLSDYSNTNKTLKDVCHWNNIYENSPINTKRVKEYIEERGKLIQIKNARFPFPVKIDTTLIRFKTPEEEKFYRSAYAIYLEERRKHGKGDPQGVRARWVAMQKFWEACELIKSYHQAELTIQRLKENPNRQIVVACNFITPLRNVFRQLIKLGFPKERISHVVGSQSAQERQNQVDKFQNGETDVLLMTVASGGTGLDLPHDSDKNKPRHVIVPLCWSVYHFIQLIGRVHRMSSKSISTEEIIGYAGTIEGEEILPRLKSKVDCIKELIDRRDSFIMDVFNKEVDEELVSEMEDSNKKEYTEHDEDGEEMMFDIDMLEIKKD